MKNIFFLGSIRNDTHIIPYRTDDCIYVLGKDKTNKNWFHIVESKTKKIVVSGSIEKLIELGYGKKLEKYSFEVSYKFKELDKNANPVFFLPSIKIDGKKVNAISTGVYWFLKEKIQNLKPTKVLDNIVVYNFDEICHLSYKNNILVCEY